MVRYTHIFFISLYALSFGLSGCDKHTTKTRKPYLMTDKTPSKQNSKSISKIEENIALAAMRAEHQEKIASIAAEKEKRLKQLDLEKSKVISQSRQVIIESENRRKITIEIEKQKASVLIAKEKATFYQQYLVAAVIFFIVLMLLFALIHRRNQALKLKLHEDELRHKEYMQASKQHHERVNKTLEILANESTDKHLKKELIGLLKDQGVEQPKLLG